MCAICGIINFNGRPVDEAALVAMRDVMVNRGPDYGGIYLRGCVGLGHRRLKIIDLSESANQPMPNEDKNVWVSFNGEIYNFQELRAQLSDRGHRFQSRSDTECLVHGYEEWGEGLFEKLDGMFALGLWDARAERLVLARDRFGKKPLFYLERDGRVHFASDIKGIWHLNGSRLTLNPQAIDCYLHHLSPTQEHCIFSEIAKIRPAHYRVFTARGSTETRYWQPSFREKQNLTEPEALELIETTLRAAVRKRLISDVPLGAFLSGGVDSSLVVALMSQIGEGRPRTFSIGFEESDFSEIQFSRAVAQRYQTDHQEIILKPDVLTILPSLIWEYGEPFADSSAIPTYYVSKAARQFVTVALTGDGGDEMFGGYDIARASWYAYQLGRFLPVAIRRDLEARLVGNRIGMPTLQKLRTLLVHASSDPRVRHSFTQGWTPAEKQQLYTQKFKDDLGGHAAHHIFDEYATAIAPLNVIDQNLFLTLVGRLPNDYLIKVDVASMKNSLELRSPFLDCDLARLSESIDPLIKVRWGRQKYLLKKLAERFLPREVIYRKKRGFSLPLSYWLQGNISPLVSRFLSRGCLMQTGWFDQGCVEKLLVEHRTRLRDHTHRIWSLFWLELWFRTFTDKTLKPSDSLQP